MKYLLTLFTASLLLFSSCSSDLVFEQSVSNDAQTISGSYTSFLVLGEKMYVISKRKLQTYDVADEANPKLVNDQEVGFNIESLLHHKGNLFIGSAEAMFIYSIDENGIPERSSVTEYQSLGNDFCRNDPIAVNDQYAFASLSSKVTGECGRFDMNEVRVYDIDNLQNPTLVHVVGMDSPRGIALDGNLLFVCEAETGLKVLDVSNPVAPFLLNHFQGFQTFDAIANDGLLVVVGPRKLYEFDYSNPKSIRLLSEIKI